MRRQSQQRNPGRNVHHHRHGHGVCPHEHHFHDHNAHGAVKLAIIEVKLFHNLGESLARTASPRRILSRVRWLTPVSRSSFRIPVLRISCLMSSPATTCKGNKNKNLTWRIDYVQIAGCAEPVATIRPMAITQRRTQTARRTLDIRCAQSRSFSGLHPSKRQSGTEESQGRINPSQPSSRLRDQNLANSGIRIGSDCWVRFGSNIPSQNEGTNDDKGKDCIYLGSGDYS